MRPTRVVADLLADDFTGVPAAVFTQRVANVAELLPCVVVTTAGGSADDERFALRVDVVLDVYAATAQAGETLAYAARAVLLDAVRTHRGLRDVTSTQLPTQVAEPGQPSGLARWTALYTVALPTLPG